MVFKVLAAAVALLVICADARIIRSENGNLNAQTLSLNVENLSASTNVNGNDANAAVNATIRLGELANQLSSLLSSNNTAAVSTVVQQIESLLETVGTELSGALDILPAVGEVLGQIQSGNVNSTSLSEIASEVAQLASNGAIKSLGKLANQLFKLATSNNTGELGTVLQQIESLLESMEDNLSGGSSILPQVRKVLEQIQSGRVDGDLVTDIASAIIQVVDIDVIGGLVRLATRLLDFATSNNTGELGTVVKQIEGLLQTAASAHLSFDESLLSEVSNVLDQIQSGNVNPTSISEIASEVLQVASNGTIKSLGKLANQLFKLATSNNTGELGTVLQQIESLLESVEDNLSGGSSILPQVRKVLEQIQSGRVDGDLVTDIASAIIQVVDIDVIGGLVRLATHLLDFATSNNTGELGTVVKEIEGLLQTVASAHLSFDESLLSEVSKVLDQIQSGNVNSTSISEIATEVLQVASNGAIKSLGKLANQLFKLATSNNTGELGTVLQQIESLLVSVEDNLSGGSSILPQVRKVLEQIQSGRVDGDLVTDIASAIIQVVDNDVIGGLVRLATRLLGFATSNNTGELGTVVQQIESLLQTVPNELSGALNILPDVSEVLEQIQSGNFNSTSLSEIATEVLQVASNGAIARLSKLAKKLSGLASSNNTAEVFTVLQEIETLLQSGVKELSGAPSILSAVSDALSQIQSGNINSTSLTNIASKVGNAAFDAAIASLDKLAKQLSYSALINNTPEVLLVLLQIQELLQSLLNSGSEIYSAAIQPVATSVSEVVKDLLQGVVPEASLSEVVKTISQLAKNLNFSNAVNHLSELSSELSGLISSGNTAGVTTVLKKILALLEGTRSFAPAGASGAIETVISSVSAVLNISSPSIIVLSLLSGTLSSVIAILRALLPF